ncbi:MAG: hypothetical protein E7655_00955 [Ruminococcaceae bacterium]|nr:hypothetical protein [Oscillospiraceae bacterium]
MSYLYENDCNIFDVSKVEDGNLLVKVCVKNFSGQYVYCIGECNLKGYIQSLQEFDKAESGTYQFYDMDSDSYIDFEKTEYGHMKISGQLGCTFGNNYLMFEMEADQTVITALIERLK